MILFLAVLWKYPTFLRDARIGFINYKVRVGVDLIQYLKGTFTLIDQWDITCAKRKNNACIVFEGHTLTFGEIDRYANQLAHWALDTGLVRGDVVALFMGNSPEFFCTWLGLAKVGVECAFINTNIRGDSLLHSVKVCKARLIISSPELASAVSELTSDLVPLHISHHILGPEGNMDLHTRSECKPSAVFRKNVTYLSPLYYIFTSGTTGNNLLPQCF